ncbi:MAG: type II toxin-antitoxin system HicA family toxin [Bacteroidales bacterium]|nr:type II toxin-antitoxin system HicA family toxin [Bacteroidales bacterium]
MKYAEITRRLKEFGCRFVRHGANHDWWYSPITQRRFLVPRHPSQEAKPGTLRSISLQSGVSF